MRKIVKKSVFVDNETVLGAEPTKCTKIWDAFGKIRVFCILICDHDCTQICSKNVTCPKNLTFIGTNCSHIKVDTPTTAVILR